MKKFILIVFVLGATIHSGFSQNKELKAFPAAWNGVERFVIELPEKDVEDNYKVEVMVGKTMKVDCNHHSLLGKFVSKDVKGWGYTYYKYVSEGKTRSTLMACPDNKMEDKFIADAKQVRYNSKLPIVVYVPKGFEVKYKIWERQEKEEDAAIK